MVLTENDKYFEPDIIVVLDSRKIKRDGCYGAPDVIFEIIFKSTRKTDYEEKQSVYLENHVHMLVEIPSKMSVSDFVGYLKGKVL